eukprot:Pgem_evm1s14338
MVNFFRLAFGLVALYSGFGEASKSKTLIDQKKLECKPHNTCYNWNGTCNNGATPSKDKSIICRIGLSCQKRCCKKEVKTCAEWSENESCGDFGMVNKTDMDNVSCKGDQCNENDCCQPVEDDCSSFQCTENHIPKQGADKIFCGDSGCSDKKCCDKQPKCSSHGGFKCSDGKIAKDDLDTIRCQGKKCTDDECCVVEENCDGFKCDEHHVIRNNPNQIKCGNNGCSNKECCKPFSSCAEWSGEGFDCADYGLKSKDDMSKIACKGKACNKDMCCEKATCEDWVQGGNTCKKFNLINRVNMNDIACKGTDCKASECCIDQEYCGKYKCPTSHVIKRGAETIECGADGCQDSECCEIKETCAAANFQCPPHYIKKSDYHKILCQGVDCVRDECCEKQHNCHGFKCPNTHVIKHHPKNIKCPAGGCTKDQCCEVKETCAATKFKCPAGQIAKKNYHSIVCQGVDCTATECCVKEDDCSGFQCGAGSLIKKDAHNIKCKSEKCQQSQCCDSINNCASWDKAGGMCEALGKIDLPGSSNKRCIVDQCYNVHGIGMFYASNGDMCHIPTMPDVHKMCGNFKNEVNLVPCLDSEKPNVVKCVNSMHKSGLVFALTKNHNLCHVVNPKQFTLFCGGKAENKRVCGPNDIKDPRHAASKAFKNCKEECCAPKRTCASSGFKCTGGKINRADFNTKKCNGFMCTAAECCATPPTCPSSGYNCAAKHPGWHNKPNWNQIRCKGLACNHHDCCQLNPTCPQGRYNCGKHPGWINKPNYNSVRCKGLACTYNDCCQKDTRKKCPNYNFRINTHHQNLGWQTLSAPTKYTITTSHPAHVKVTASNNYIQSSQCAFNTRHGVKGEVWLSITTHKVTSGYVYFDFSDETGANCRYQIAVRSDNQRAHGKIWGDPHTISLDGAKHSYSKGQFATVFKAYDFLIKAHFHHGQDNRHPLSTMNHMSIQYKNTFIEIYSPHNYNFYQYPQQLHASYYANLGEPAKICWSSQHINNRRHHYELVFPCGSRLKLSVVYGDAYWDWFIQIEDFWPSALYRGHVEHGLMGNWNGNWRDDFGDWRYSASGTQFEWGLKNNGIPTNIGRTVCSAGHSRTNENNYCSAISHTLRPLGGVRRLGRRGESDANINTTTFLMEEIDKDLEGSLEKAKAAYSKMSEKKESSCNKVKHSKWGKLSLSSGCMDEEYLDFLVKSCVEDLKSGSTVAAVDLAELIVRECVSAAEIANEEKTDEFYLFAKKNGFDSCNYPKGGKPTEKGCHCYEGFSGK